MRTHRFLSGLFYLLLYSVLFCVLLVLGFAVVRGFQ